MSGWTRDTAIHLVALTVLFPATGVAAQQVETTGVVTKALDLQRLADFTSARDLLANALARCPIQAEVKACSSRLDYALGYIHQQEAARAPTGREQLLQSAAEYYQSALNATPTNVDAVYNLAIVYRQMGAHEWQQPFFEGAARRDPSRAGIYDVLKGDYYRDRGMRQQALAAYEAAVQVRPDDDVARSRLVSATADAPSGAALRRLISVYESWEARYPDAALAGYLAVIDASRGSDVALARETLVRWASLMAQQRRVNAGMLGALPRDWQDESVRDLAAYLENPIARPATRNWWLQSQDRRDALARVGLALGDTWIANGNYARTDSCWNAALHLVPRGAPSAIDLTRELSLLYFRVPSLDPDQSRFRSLEKELFSEKGAAIMRGDLPTTQRFHTVLGLIYASYGTWGGFGARNATYQLERALQTAAQRDRLERSYQPLGGMHDLLGQAYAETGRRPAAAAAYLTAARAHLDSDQLGAAERASARAQEAGASEESVTAVRRVLDIRRRIAGAEPGSSGLREVCGTSSLAAQPDARDEAVFLARQSFKVWSDCALAGASQAPRRAADAVQLVAGRGMPLANLGDLRRLEGVRAAVLAGVGLAADALPVDPTTEPLSGDVEVGLMLPGEDHAVRVRLDARSVLVSAIVAGLPTTMELPRLKVEGGEVTLVDVPEGVDRSALVRALRAVPGVTAVKDPG